MKTTTNELNSRKERKQGFVVFICNKLYDLLSVRLGYSRVCIPSEERQSEVDREDQFKGYVNNRMNILLLWIQHVKERNVTAMKKQLGFFLWDMEHHFVDPHAGKEVRDAYRWVRAFVSVYPRVTKRDRLNRVYGMIGKIYESLGLEFPFRASPVRS